MTKRSSKRLVVESVLENVKRAQDALTMKKCDRASCHTSWTLRRELAAKFTESDQKDCDRALAGYDRDIEALSSELEKWHEALGHALDTLEGQS